MSASNINDKLSVHSCGGYNFYSVISEGKKYIIGGVPKGYSEIYINEAKFADALIFLTSKPEFCGGLDELLEYRPDIKIYASSAALRNIRETVNREFNEGLIKDMSHMGEITFLITPNLHWVDSCMAIVSDVLISGEMFSGFDGSAVGLKNYFDRHLAVNKTFVLSALDRIEKFDINTICPAYGMICPQGEQCISALPHELFDKYREWLYVPEKEKISAVVVYSSEYGFTASLGEYAADLLREKCDVSVFDLKKADTKEAATAVNNADMLLVGTNTINRNAPVEIWEVITRIDTVNKRGITYFVFGSFGWAGDGIKLTDKTLSALGLKQVSKPVEVLLKPKDEDFVNIRKAVDKIIEYTNKTC